MSVVRSVLPVAWLLLPVAGAAAHRASLTPSPRRPQLDQGGAGHRTDGRWRSAGRRLGRAFETLGHALLSLGGRRRPSGAVARRTGAVAVAAALTAVALPPLGAAVAVAGAAGPVLAERRRHRRRLGRFESEVPDLVDLFLLCVDAGLTVPLAVDAVGRRAPGDLAAELRGVIAEVGRGRRLADALEQLPGRTTESVRPLTAVLVASERYGTPVADALQRLAVEVRIAAQRRAEEAARRLPVTLLFPLVLCILPAFALLTVAPLVANGLRSLSL